MTANQTVEARSRAAAEAPSASATGAQAPAADAWLLNTLEQGGFLTATQIEGLRQTRESSFWSAAVHDGLVTDEQILGAISSRFKVPVADLNSVESRMASLLPEMLARKYQVLPISADDRTIQVATSDPRDLALEQTLAFVTGRDVLLQAAAPSAIAKRIEEIYHPEITINRLVDGFDRVKVEMVDDTPAEPAVKDPSMEAPMARLVDAMISDAVREGASDIHAEPLPEGTSVRYRIDGIMKEVMRLPSSAGPALVRRVKILARLDVTDPLHPHDGRTGVRVDGKQVDLRVSTVPVARRGEKVVIRILDKANLHADLNDLQLLPNELDLFQRLLGHREGIVLVTGPTGSGKTTTLYAALNQLKTGKVNIVTVEDPVEYEIGGISQLQVSEAQGFTFATALRSVLRQDPDVILVGEIRDNETAAIAAQAGLSGHLVLSTLHTNDAPSATVRLRDLGVDNFKLGSVLRGIVAQRLVRRLCRSCAEPVPIDALPPEARPPESLRDGASPKRAVGCKACGGSGYKGRLPVFEVLPVDERVALLIGQGALPDVLVSAGRAAGMRTLWESGVERMWLGDTSLEEIVRVLGEYHEEPVAGAVPIIPIPASEIALPTPAPLPPSATAPASPRAPIITAQPAAPRSIGPAKSGEGVRVLIADDDRQMRRLVRTVLERDGYDVAEAADGLDALDLVESGQFGLMILDIDMPRLDGLGVLEELRARVLTSSIPVIVLTARGDDTETQVFDLGAQDFLRKPVQPPSLLARVRAVLRRSKLA